MKKRSTKRFNRITRQTFYCLLLQVIIVGGLQAVEGRGQGLGIDEITLTVKLEKTKIAKAFAILEQESGFEFAYFSSVIDRQKRVNLVAENETLRKVLENLSLQTGLRFKRVNNKIFVDKKSGEQPVVTNGEAMISEEVRVSGKVTSAVNGDGLPGVSILIKSTTTGTSTDIDGNYFITVPDDAVLQFSFIGFITQEIAVGNQSIINVTLEPDLAELEEVVVIGYGTQKKSDVTGAISSVEPTDITRLSERRLESALQGRAAGVQVMRTEGSPGASSTINIRGVGSIGNTNPLWIIDGVPMDPGNFFNPADVESIEILKDASASAIYGARAAHGVILVTTKRGSEGEIKVNLNAQVGMRQSRPLPDMLNSVDFAAASTEARVNAGQSPESSWDNPETLPNTDWVDEIFSGSGLEQMYNISVSGGNEKATFFISGAYDKEEGIMVNNWFDRFAIRANSDFKIGKRITLGESILVSRTRENPSANDGGDLQTVFRAIPIMPVRDPNNPFGGWGTAPAYFQGPNPLASQEQNHILNTNNRINGNVYANVDIIEGLSVRGSFGFNVTALHVEDFTEAFNYGALSNPIASLTHRSRDLEQINTNLVVTYTKSFDRHDITAMAGYERFRSDAIDFRANAQDFPITRTRSFGLATGAVDISDRTTIDDQYRLRSFFGRINYAYDNKYLLTVNIRRDGSSRFGEENQYGVFPSFSVGWRMKEENFMQGIDWLADLKLRVSYGVLGSDRIGNYIFSPTYRNSRSTYVFDPTGQSDGTKQRGFYLRRFPNQEVKWEEIVQTNIGVDVAFLDGKFNLTADYYIKNTTDMLIGVQLPPSFGVSRARSNPERTQINIGEVENSGFELSLNYVENIGDLKLDITGNATWNQNEVKFLNEDQRIFSGGGGHGYSNNISVTEAGQPMGVFFGWISEGIIQTQEEIDALNAQSPTGVYQNNETSPGDLRYRDIDGDGRITPDDRTYIGNPWPELIYGLNVNLGYKNFDFTMFFQGVQGVDIFNAPKAYTRTVFSDYNTSDLAFERWTPENPTEHPRLIATDPNGNFRRPSTYHVEDGSFLRLRNIQLGYAFPVSLIEKAGLSQARIFVNAQNILTFTGYEGVDPEIVGTGAENASSSNIQRGIDHYRQYPQTTLISTGVQIGF